MSQQSLSCWLKKSSTSSDIIKESQGCSNAPESIDVSINKLASTTSTQPVTEKMHWKKFPRHTVKIKTMMTRKFLVKKHVMSVQNYQHR